MESPEERMTPYLNPSGSFMSSSAFGSMGEKAAGTFCPPEDPEDSGEPFCPCEPPCRPPSSPSAHPTRTPEEPAASAAEPVPRKVRNRRRLIPSGGWMSRSLLSFLIL